MLRLALAVGGSIAAMIAPAWAGDQDLDALALAVPAETGFYVNILGGATLPGLIEVFRFGNKSAQATLPTSGAVAAAVGWNTGLGGLSVELDGFYTRRDYSFAVNEDYTVTTGSLMGNLKYTIALTEAISVYAAAGLGAVYMHDEDRGGGLVYVDGWMPGYQVQLGVSTEVTEGIALIAEYRYTNTFGAFDFKETTNEYSERVSTSAVLVGAQFSF